MTAEKFTFKQACERLGIELKPTEKTRREIQQQIRKRGLVRQFNRWCSDRHDDLCRLYRTLQKAKDNCQTDADVERIASYYHLENSWLQEIGILQGNDQDSKLDLYTKEVMKNVG
jgi:hypothetical protein